MIARGRRHGMKCKTLKGTCELQLGREAVRGTCSFRWGKAVQGPGWLVPWCPRQGRCRAPVAAGVADPARWVPGTAGLECARKAHARKCSLLGGPGKEPSLGMAQSTVLELLGQQGPGSCFGASSLDVRSRRVFTHRSGIWG